VGPGVGTGIVAGVETVGAGAGTVGAGVVEIVRNSMMRGQG